MKFGDMPYGTHFREANRSVRKARKFIKIMNKLPSGIPILMQTYCTADYDCWGKLYKEGQVVHKDINAIDYSGISARCPDWLAFEVIKFPKWYKAQA